jgi:predicted DNA-binding transcriptional regulator AlpA
MTVVTTNPEPAVLDKRTFAALLNCSTRHLDRLVSNGRAPRPVKLGSLLRWPRAAIERWILEGCPAVNATAQGGNNERR